MSANQTIDGVLVSRQLLCRVITTLEKPSEKWEQAGWPVASELRALLDAPAEPKPTGLSQGWNLTRKHDGFVVGHQSLAYPPDEKAIERAERDGYVWVPFLVPSAQPKGEPVACAHDWLDGGEYLIVCTKCGAQENHDPCWRDMASAPTDGTMVRLLVEFEEHSTEDADQAPTIGTNNFDNDGEDVWRFVGWCWSHDHFTEGKGTPVGWLPMLPDPICIPASTS